MAHLIAIAAPIGGGKTTLAAAVATALGDASTVHFDRYERATRRPAAQLADWLRRGGDFEEFMPPELLRDLVALRRGESVQDPGGMAIPARKHVICDLPMGNAASSLAGRLDLVFWIDVPLDVALARKLREYIQGFLRDDDPGAPRRHLAWLDQFLGNYLAIVRQVLCLQRERVAAGADVILDGEADLGSLARRVVQEIRQRLPEA
jgi:uridine kinase